MQLSADLDEPTADCRALLPYSIPIAWLLRPPPVQLRLACFEPAQVKGRPEVARGWLVASGYQRWYFGIASTRAEARRDLKTA